VPEFLARGGIYRCILLDPQCAATRVLSEYRGENLQQKIQESIAAFTGFKKQHRVAADGLRVQLSSTFIGFAAIVADLSSVDPLILYSPYLMSTHKLTVEHGDSPHYLATPLSGRLLSDISRLLSVSTILPPELPG